MGFGLRRLAVSADAAELEGVAIHAEVELLGKLLNLGFDAAVVDLTTATRPHERHSR
ncbi:MAG TPA: hypothetical protein VFA49_06245 [Chloroflexota bacterium]|nr:hypothetical protein [Chloroflexota bacterium]